MLVLDANILIRAVPGSKVLRLLTEYSGKVLFLAPDSVFDEAREHLPAWKAPTIRTAMLSSSISTAE